MCVTRCSGDTLDTYVERPYSPAPSGNSHLSKPLKQRDSSNPERILLLIRYKNVRMTQTRLTDIPEGIADRQRNTLPHREVAKLAHARSGIPLTSVHGGDLDPRFSSGVLFLFHKVQAVTLP